MLGSLTNLKYLLSTSQDWYCVPGNVDESSRCGSSPTELVVSRGRPRQETDRDIQLTGLEAWGLVGGTVRASHPVLIGPSWKSSTYVNLCALVRSQFSSFLLQLCPCLADLSPPPAPFAFCQLSALAHSVLPPMPLPLPPLPPSTPLGLPDSSSSSRLQSHHHILEEAPCGAEILLAHSCLASDRPLRGPTPCLCGPSDPGLRAAD